MITVDIEFISIPEWGRRMGVSKVSAYKAARLGEIPGCFAIGRLYRVNWSAFVDRSSQAGGYQGSEDPAAVSSAMGATRAPRISAATRSLSSRNDE
jgi:hypothetical protein